MSKARVISIKIDGRLFEGGLMIDRIPFVFASSEQLAASLYYSPTVVSPRASVKSILYLDKPFDPPHFVPVVKVDGVERKVSYEVCSDGIRRVFFCKDNTLISKAIYIRPCDSGEDFTLLFPEPKELIASAPPSEVETASCLADTTASTEEEASSILGERTDTSFTGVTVYET